MNRNTLNYTGQKYIRLFSIISCIGLVVYSSSFINELANPDTMWSGLYQRDKWMWECSLGRYMLRIWQEIFGTIINPTAFTIIAILLVAGIGVIVVDILQIEGIAAVLVGSILMLSPAVAGTLTYYYCSLYYIIAYMLAVMVCWIVCKKEKWYFLLIAMFLLCISLATYQAYIGIVAVITLFYILQMILDEKTVLKDIIIRGGYIATAVIGGIVFYLISNKIFQVWWGVSPEAGRGFAKMGIVPMERFGIILKNCYIYMYQYFFSNEMINNFYGLKKEINMVYFFLLCISCVFVLVKCEKSWVYIILSIICIGILPLAVMSITIVAPEVSIYDTTGVIMLPTVNYSYILLFSLGRHFHKNKIIKNIYKGGSYLIASIICFSLFVFVLMMQTYHKICINKMDYISKEIVNAIEDTVDNSNRYTLCFWGNVENGNYPDLYPELKNKIQWTTSANGTVWKWYDWNPGIAGLCWIGYINQYVGKEYNLCDGDIYQELVNSDVINSMNNFPDENSITVYNDSVIIIKLADL